MQYTLIPLLASGAMATQLFVTSYAGTLTTLNLTQSGSNYSVESIATDKNCGVSPSWLTLDRANDLLYCIDENTSVGYAQGGQGGLNSYRINADGSLVHTAHQNTSAGPVSGVLFDPSAIAIAHYDGGAISVNHIDQNGIAEQITEQFFEAPTENNAHEVILEPSGRWIIVPDLGADKLRVFLIDPATANVTEKSPHVLPAKTGPRHGSFYQPEGSEEMFFYLVSELSNTLRGFNVVYDGDELQFKELFVTNTFGGADVPAGAAAAEIAISPDNKFVLVSNRNATAGGTYKSDPIGTWAIGQEASLKFLQLKESGGPFPRQFSLNAAGDVLAAGLSDGRVVFLGRDVQSGLLGDVVATQPIDGTITCVQWNEK